MKKSSRHDLDVMKKALSKKNLEAFDHHRMQIRTRYNADRSCPIEVMEILTKSMPEGEAEEYARLCRDANIIDFKRITRAHS